MSRIVCLKAQTILSMMSLNCAGGRVNKAKKREIENSFNTLKIQQTANLDKLLIHTREAMLVNGTKQFEKSNTMFGIFRKVFINHIKRAFKDSIENRGNFVCNSSL